MAEFDQAKLAAAAREYLWLPFTQMRDFQGSEPLIVAAGEGRKLIDVQGREYYDAVSSIWLNVHGHRTPEIDDAIRAQLDRIAHSTLLGLTNVPAIELAEALVRISPDSLRKVFYSDSGSEAVEIGLKIAYQYWRHRGESKRRYFVKMRNAYHGDTIGAVSAGGIDLFHSIYKDLLFPTLDVPYPNPYRFDGSPGACSQHCLEVLDEVLCKRGAEVCGVILEPLVQGAAGMIMMPEGFLADAAALCHEHGVLLLADEVATGFGRTGRMFACEHEDVQPDILMCAKGLTGGYLPVAATLTSDEVYNAFLGDYSEQKTVFHGHSYTGNQLGCAAAIANLRLMAERDTVGQVARRADLLAEGLAPLRDIAHVGDVRQRGFMVGIELVQDKQTKEPFDWRRRMAIQVCDRAVALGMFIRPLGNVVIFMPPPGSTDEELRAMLAILQQAHREILEP